MIYKAYGKTGKKVSAIGFGGMRFPSVNGVYDYDYCIAMIQKANELGINYFDTAPGYCNDKSEIIMGKAFKNMPNEFYVSTKSMEKTAVGLRKGLESSLKRLNVNKINFFHIWSVLSLDDYKIRMKKGGAYEEALKAKSEGLIEHIVISTHCSGTEIYEIVNDNMYEGILLGYNILNFPYRQKGVEAAYKNGWGVVTMNPLSGGLIPKIADKIEFIKEEGKSIVDSAINFNASQKEISIVLTGMNSIESVQNNASVGSNITSISKERFEYIEKNLGANMDSLCTGCQYCEPCPVNIEPSKYMLAYNSKIFGNSDDALGVIKWHWGIPQEKTNECIECGVCEQKCTQHLPIIERLKEIGSW